MIAAKFLDDLRLKNKDFAKIGGISNKEINLLEMEILSTIDFDLNISQKLFKTYLKVLLSA